MQLFYEIFPIFLFFIAFKFYDIYIATLVGILATLVQAVFTRMRYGKWDRKQVITFAVFVIFGGMTLYFHDPIFIKWKPTIVFCVFALIILGSQLLTQKPLMQRLLEHMLQGKCAVPAKVWKRVNILWATFFLLLAGINLYIAYHFDNNTWVNFKFYGITSAVFLFGLIQALYLMRYSTEIKYDNNQR